MRSSGEGCCNSEPIHPLLDLFHDLFIIGGKLYVMRDGLIKYCRFCVKCVSIGQRRMWRSTPKTNGKEKLEETV